MTVRAWGMILLVILLLCAGFAYWIRGENEAPVLRFEDSAGEFFLGKAGKRFQLDITDLGSGLREVTVRIKHANGEVSLASEFYEASLLTGGGPASAKAEITIDPVALQLPPGSAMLVAEANDWSWANFFSGNRTSIEVPVTVDLEAPRLSVSSGLTYVQRAGSGIVRYRVREDTALDGVRVGDVIFPGHALPGGRVGERVALFAIPRNAEKGVTPHVFARDRAGNERRVAWPVRVQERSFVNIPIRLWKGFMDNKVPELANELGIEADNPIALFQTINRDERARNEEKIRSIVATASALPRFEGVFIQMRNSAVTSQFAEHRTYFLNGEKISEAIHYGYDLASVAGATIEASNAGEVRYAAPLGIYGNCVILDHGLGLSSLYAHLQEIHVEEGDLVRKGQTLGRSGATGLAGGDHLHFAMLVGSTYVEPKEWWDPKWLRDHITPALRTESP